MRPSTGLQQNQTQKQVLSARMIQSVRILQMDSMELAAYVQEVAVENPIIDLDAVQKRDALYAGEASSRYDDQLRRKLEWLNTYDEQNRVLYQMETDHEDDRDGMNNASAGENLQDYLMSQLLLFAESKEDYDRLLFLICSLDHKGYLSENTGILAKHLSIGEDELDRYIRILQSAEPAGIGARNLAECLMLQIERRLAAGEYSETEAKHLQTIVLTHLKDLGKQHYDKIAKSIGAGQDETKDLCRKLRQLNPIPRNSIAERTNLKYVRPDVTVVKFEDGFDILVNDAEMPKIIMNDYYLRMLKQDSAGEAADYIREKYAQAQWVIAGIEERKKTLLAVTHEIVRRQLPFFEQEDGQRQRLSLKEVAKQVGISESTVSRTIKNKFLQCPRGLFPMRYFFVRGIERKDASGEATPEAVKAQIGRLIREENKSRPLSDQKLTDLLQAQGITISRRTVAKYRTECMIPDASGRKILKA